MQDSVRERVPETPVCLPRSSGWGDKESSEDFSRSIEKPRRSPTISIITSTSVPRVISSRTSPSLLNQSTRWSKRRSERPNSRSKEKPEESRPLRRRKREIPERLLPWVSSRPNQRRRRYEHQHSIHHHHRLSKSLNKSNLPFLTES